MRRIWLSTPSGRHRGLLATGFLDRLLGFARAGDDHLLVIPGSSVHGIWLRTRLDIAGISVDGSITGVRELRPGRFVRMQGASHVIEARPGVVRLEPGQPVSMSERHG